MINFFLKFLPGEIIEINNRPVCPYKTGKADKKNRNLFML
jgi:hypothetical protein